MDRNALKLKFDGESFDGRPVETVHVDPGDSADTRASARANRCSTCDSGSPGDLAVLRVRIEALNVLLEFLSVLVPELQGKKQGQISFSLVRRRVRSSGKATESTD